MNLLILSHLFYKNFLKYLLIFLQILLIILFYF
nr:MAG TPA: hypothetical protein [Bacteriophage sp.]